MRAILVLLGIVVVVLIVGLGTGFINLSSRGGTLPKVSVEGGKLPTVNADVGKVDVGTKTEVVKVPTVAVKKPGE